MLSIANIRTQLATAKQPLIAQCNYWDVFGESHVVVIYGIDGDKIGYMDPDGGRKIWEYYNIFLSNQNFSWKGTLTTDKYCSSRGDPCPCHCLNGEFEPWLDELGIDCGGDCQPCNTPPPPTSNCTDCKKNGDEEQIDCGGPDCPTCEEVPQVRNILWSSFLKMARCWRRK